MIAVKSGVPPLGMTPGQAVRTLESDLGLTMKDLQAVLDTTPRNINRWIAEQAHPQHEARRRLAALMALHRHLGGTFTAMEGARDWLRCPSRYLSGMTPLEAIRAGRIDRAEAALGALDAGVYL